MRKSMIGGFITVLMMLSACGGNESSLDVAGTTAEASVENVVSVIANEYAYSMPAEVEGGIVSLELANEGAEHHEFAFGRLDEGVEIEDVAKSILQRGGGETSEDLAGVPLLSPGANMTMVRDLEPGTYFFICAFPDPNFEQHASKGMYTSFKVTGDAGVEPPLVDATIEVTDDGFEIPNLNAGEQVVEFRNSGSKEHEFVLAMAVEEGAGTKDFEHWIGKGQKGRSPLFFPGGLQSIPPGTSVIQVLDLERGDYLMEDFGNKLEAEFSIR